MNLNIVGAAWIFHQKKLLLIFHKKHNKWLPVAGHSEENESPEETTIREVKEEVGLDIIILHKATYPSSDNRREIPLPFRIVYSSIGRNGHELFFDYVAEAENIGSLSICEDEEIETFKWFSLEEIKNNSEITKEVKIMSERAFFEYKKLKEKK